MRVFILTLIALLVLIGCQNGNEVLEPESGSSAVSLESPVPYAAEATAAAIAAAVAAGIALPPAPAAAAEPERTVLPLAAAVEPERTVLPPAAATEPEDTETALPVAVRVPEDAGIALPVAVAVHGDAETALPVAVVIPEVGISESALEPEPDRTDSFQIDSVDVQFSEPMSGDAPDVQSSARSHSVSVESDPRAPASLGLSSGGTATVNDAPYDLVFFEHYGVNPFIDTDEDNLSTFALDVDTASYSIARVYVQDGYLPEPASVRVEEFVNSFDYGYAPPETDSFAIYVDVAPSIFGSDKYWLMRVALKGREVSAEERKDANLVFAIDVSGSMDGPERLGLVKRSLHILLDQLRDTDTIAIVTYGDQGRILLEPISGEQREAARIAVERLSSGGSTYLEDGLRLAYEVSAENFDPEMTNSVIVLSDGVGNVGRTGADSVLEQIQPEVDRGIALTTIGFGMGNFNDILMERIANRGNGTYHYVDSLSAARRLFEDELTGNLEMIARDAKVQVEFNPEVVRSYRLLGYENRRVRDDDFRNDEVDAGEIGAGHEVTALYEIKLHDGLSGPLGSVFLRYEDIRMGEVAEQSALVGPEAVSLEFDEAPLGLRMAALVAEYAEILRGSYWAQEGDLSAVVSEATNLMGEVGEVVEFIEFVGLAARARDLRGR